MTRDLSQSVVVVTGASSGLGRATAMALAQAGASVVLAARRVDPLESAALERRRIGGQGRAIEALYQAAGEGGAVTLDGWGRSVGRRLEG